MRVAAKRARERGHLLQINGLLTFGRVDERAASISGGIARSSYQGIVVARRTTVQPEVSQVLALSDQNDLDIAMPRTVAHCANELRHAWLFLAFIIGDGAERAHKRQHFINNHYQRARRKRAHRPTAAIVFSFDPR